MTCKCLSDGILHFGLPPPARSSRWSRMSAWSCKRHIFFRSAALATWAPSRPDKSSLPVQTNPNELRDLPLLTATSPCLGNRKAHQHGQDFSLFSSLPRATSAAISSASVRVHSHHPKDQRVSTIEVPASSRVPFFLAKYNYLVEASRHTSLAGHLLCSTGQQPVGANVGPSQRSRGVYPNPTCMDSSCPCQPAPVWEDIPMNLPALGLFS